SEVEQDAGAWGAARSLAEDAHALAVRTGQETPRRNALSTLASIQGSCGRTTEAREWAEEALMSDSEGERMGAGMLLGVVELSLGNPSAAALHLQPVLKEARRHGVEDPSVFPFWPDAIEALVGSGELDR